MSTKTDKIREHATAKAREIVKNPKFFSELAKRFMEKEKLYKAQILLLVSLKLEIESYLKKNHSEKVGTKTKINKSIETELKAEESKPSIYLAHYTSVETIYSILEKYQPPKEKKDYQKHSCQENKVDSKDGAEKNANILSGLRLSDASYSNDPSEGNYLKKEIARDYKWLNDAKKTTNAFICSFVSGKDGIGDKITYWQAYGKDGLGCSIQLPLDSYNEVVYRVLYGKDEVQKAKDHFKKYFEFGQKLYNKLPEKNRKDFVKKFWLKFDEIKFLYKDAGYEHEYEYRLVKISKNPEEEFIPKHPYLRRYVLDNCLRVNNILASGSKVVIGPKVINTTRLRQHLTRLAQAKELYGPQFISSKIPYRKVW